MKKLTCIFFLFSLSTFAWAQPAPASERPKLVVGIIVDQMRQEYLYRTAANLVKAVLSG